MHATRLRVGPRSRPSSELSDYGGGSRSPSLSPSRSQSRLVGGSPQSRVGSRSPSRSPPLPALSPVRVGGGYSGVGGTLPFVPSLGRHPLDDVPPLQQRLDYPTLSPQRSPINANLHQYRKFVSTPSKSDLTTLLRDALQDLYEKRPADDLLHLIFYLRNRVAKRDGIANIDDLEHAEVQRLREENMRLRRHMSPENADYAAMNELLSVDLQKKNMQLDEAKAEIQKLQQDVRRLQKELRRSRKKINDQAVELVENEWLHEKNPDDIERTLRFLFSEADMDSNGTISEEEFRHLFSSSHLKVSEEEIEFMLEAIERNEAGDIDYPAFVPTAYHLLARYHVQQKQEKEEQQLREKAAQDQRLREDNFARDYLLTELTSEELASQLRTIYAEADTNRDGRVSADEMFNLLNGVKGLPAFSMDEVLQLMQSIAGEGHDSTTVCFEEFVPVAFTVLKRLFLNEVDRASVGTADGENVSVDKPEQPAARQSEQDSSTSSLSDKSGDGDDEEDDQGDDGGGVEEQSNAEAMRQAEEYLNRIEPEALEKILHEAFQSADKDRSGYVDALELQQAFASSPVLQVYSDPQVVQHLVKQLDLNNDGQLNYMEFIPLGHDILKTIVAAELKAANDLAGSADSRQKDGDDDNYEVVKMAPTNASEMEQMMLELFLAADTDQSGTIEKAELSDVLESVPGLRVTAEIVDKIMARLDSSGSGQLNYHEFAPLAWELLNQPDSDDDSEISSSDSDDDDNDDDDVDGGQVPAQTGSGTERSASAPSNPDEMERLMFDLFTVADTDNSGTIELDELAQVLRSVPGVDVTAALVDRIMQRLDVDSDGKLHYHEFAPLAWELLSPSQ